MSYHDRKLIAEMHTYARPAGGLAEFQFAARYLSPLGFKRDAHSNLVLEIPTPTGARSSVLFSAHIDTVDHKNGRKRLRMEGDTLMLHPADVKGSCLGADCTAGVWLIMELVKAQVPGVYVIHHAEEQGCIGSGDLSRDEDFFAGVTKAIAFDRAGTTEIITHQMGRRGCSDAFAFELSRAIGMGHVASDRGVYTDTKEYFGLVSECTNLAVGYEAQHSRRETLDLTYLIRLRDHIVAIDWESLGAYRDPAAGDLGESQWSRDRDWQGGDDASEFYSSVERLVEEYPEVVAQVLVAYGVDYASLRAEIAGQIGCDEARV